MSERPLTAEEIRESQQPWGDAIMPDGSRLEWTDGPATPAPKWVLEAWTKALARRGLLPERAETTPQTATEV